MPANDVRFTYSGAAADGAPQTDPNLSLGNYRSGSPLLDATATPPINVTGVVIDRVAPRNLRGAYPSNEGIGVLRLYMGATSELTWQAPGSSQEGPRIDVSSGGAFTVNDGDDSSCDINVTVTPASLPLVDAEDDITIQRQPNRIFRDITADEAATGIILFRGIPFQNLGGAKTNTKVYIVTRWLNGPEPATIDQASGYLASGAFDIRVAEDLDAANWPNQGAFLNQASGEVCFYSSRGRFVLHVPDAGRGFLGTGAAVGGNTDTLLWRPWLQLGIEDPSVQPAGFYQTIPDEFTDPSGIGFSNAWDDTAPINVGALPSTYQHLIWLRAVIPAGALPDMEIFDSIEVSFDGP